MEKRHFLFFIAIAISFFLVNLYFQYQHQGQVTEWNAKKNQTA
jgi:hypothetical protein